MTLVSVIIPTYNTASYVAEAVESVLAQTLRNIEVIVVDDGSTDATPEILSSYGDRIRVIRQDRQGPAIGRTNGANQASGDWLAFLDADDIWLPEKTEVQLRQCGNYVMSHTNSWFIGGNLPKPLLKTAVAQQWGGRVLDQLLLGNFITTSTVMVRRDVFLRYGGFDPRYNCVMDWPLWLKICSDHELGYADMPLAYYRLQPHSISNKVRKTLPMHVRLLSEAFSPAGVARDLGHLRRKAFANSFEVNAHFAAASGDWTFAAYCALNSIRHNPMLGRPWKTFLKSLLIPCGVKY